MNERFQKAVLARYSLNALNKLPEDVCLQLLNSPIMPIKSTEDPRQNIKCYRERLNQLLNARRSNAPLIHKNIVLISRVLDLPDAATETLQLLILYRLDAPTRKLCEHVEEHYGRANVFRIISAITGIAPHDVSAVLSSSGPLVGSGIISEAVFHQYNQLDNFCNLTSQFYDFFIDSRLTKTKVIHGLLGCPENTKLTRDDFSQHGQQIDYAIRILRGALKQKTKGLNILLYGAPGVGKTELAAVLAHGSQCNVYSVAEGCADGKSDLSGSERLAQLKTKSQLLSKFCKKSIILFDEMEDIVETAHRHHWHSISKIYLNRLIEQGETPVIWTSNSISDLDPAVLRRMSFILEVKPQSLKARARILNDYAAANNFKLANADCATLAQEYHLAPAMLTSAVSTAKLAEGTPNDVRMSLAAVSKAIYGPAAVNRYMSAPNFYPTLINSTVNLTEMIANLTQSAEKNYSLCIYGPPGTGKTAFAHHLVKSVGLQISIKRASDLLSAYWGGTEQNIAHCFEDAIEQGTVLLFDEVDSLLRTRSTAHYSWEATCVNEMLTHMESHPLPFICTTNLMDIVDEAALRRFTFKLKFDYLTPAQLNDACKQLCDVPMDKYVERITLGDVVAIQKKLSILEVGKKTDTRTLHQLLIEESLLKAGNSRKIGF